MLLGETIVHKEIITHYAFDLLGQVTLRNTQHTHTAIRLVYVFVYALVFLFFFSQKKAE